MYIDPQTNIRILKNSPVDPDYTNTLWFNTRSQQTTYFQSLTKYNLTNYSYQRVGRGVARVGIKNDNLYDCNYMMFQNTAFGNKWFYAFITHTEFVNNETSEIHFEIDVIQTWGFDFTINKCFVEREHSVDDIIGDNLIAEPVALGDYLVEEIKAPSSWEQQNPTKCVVIASSEWWDGTGWHTSPVGKIGGIFSGLYLKSFGVTSAQDIQLAKNYIEKFSEDGKIESIVAVWETYYEFLTEGGYTDYISMNRTNTLGSYTPRNKKLLSYPFKLVELTTPKGNSKQYKYERFGNGNAFFGIFGSFNGSMSFVAVPNNYMLTDDMESQINLDECLPFESSAIQCSYLADSYKAWLAQNSYNLPLGEGVDLPIPKQFAKGMAMSLAGASTENVSMFSQGGTMMVDSIADVLQRSEWMPTVSKGGGMCGNTIAHVKYYDYYKLFGKCVSPEYASMIDDFFDLYGYQTNRVKVPNRNSRPHWNYVKTKGCTLNGSIPSDDEKLICSIHDKGITYWKNGDEVGHYELNNSPS